MNVYPVNTNSIRADIGLKAEADKQKSESRTADVRIKVTEIFEKNDIQVTESSFISV